MSTVAFPQISQHLLYAVRTGKSDSTLLEALSGATPEQLAVQLGEDCSKKAFWLNIYNAFVQKSLENNPQQYKKRLQFYKKRFIPVAGKLLSLDDIEHGILRRSTLFWSFGYLTNPFVSGFERRFRVEKIDYRIHFALNCGAFSCPPIAFYTPERVEQQLQMATEVYLEGECKFDAGNNKVVVPRLMQWFWKDFSGRAGIVNLLETCQIIPHGAKPRITFKSYNWEMKLKTFTDTI